MPLEAAVQGDAGAKNGMVRSHRFLGANTALPHLRGDAEQERRTLENLRGRASLALLWSGPARVDALMRARGVGHRLPGGTMDSNEVWLEVTALDAAGKAIAMSGGRGRDGALDREAHLVRAQPVDAHGAPLDPTRSAAPARRGVRRGADPVRSAGGAVRGAARHGARAGAAALPQVHRRLRGVRLRRPAAEGPGALPGSADRRDRRRRDRRGRAAHRRSGDAGRLGARARGRHRGSRRGGAGAARGGAGEVAGARGAAARARRAWRSSSGRPTTSSASRARRARASPSTRRRWRWRRARCSTPTGSPRRGPSPSGSRAACPAIGSRSRSRRARAASPATPWDHSPPPTVS